MPRLELMGCSCPRLLGARGMGHAHKSMVWPHGVWCVGVKR